MNIDFSDPVLVSKYGSWARVQVAFYDYIFHVASGLCAAHWKDLAIKELSDGFADGQDLYERTVRGIEAIWETPIEAWNDFRKQESPK